MKKIGIITFFYNNYNYGGLLQAYALEKFINREMGNNCVAEQILYDNNAVKIALCDRALRFMCRGNIAKKIQKAIKRGTNIETKNQTKELEQTRLAMKEFALSRVVHSTRVYNEKDYKAAEDEYDVFICGSDQIWNPVAIRNAYLLKGIKKKKFSYAASIAAGDLKIPEKIKYRKALKDMDAISVREKSAAIRLQSILHRDVEVVVDPTFLLEPDEWISILQEKSVITEKYAFVYLLGKPSKELLDVLNSYKQSGGKVVTISGITEVKADISLGKSDPIDFLSLIKNADYVFTDSFHAVAFSVQFSTKFNVVKRQGAVINMSERISDFLEMVGLQNAFLTNLEDFTKQKVVFDFDKAHAAIKKEREKSISFLRINIERCI